MKYDTLEELKLRLHGTVFLHGPNVVVGYDEGQDVAGINGLALCVKKVGKRDPGTWVDPNNDTTLSTKLPNGYINHQNSAYYTSRMPVRRYKAGWFSENVTNMNPFGRHTSFQNLCSGDDMQRFVDGVYPTLDKTCESLIKVNEEQDDTANAARAINRRCAIVYDRFRKDFILFHRVDKVAWGNGTTFKLLDEFGHLKESLTEKGIRCVI